MTAAGAAAADGGVRPDCRFAGAMCGLVDARGEVVMEPKYDFIGEFSDGYAVFGQGGTYGILSTSGREVTPAVYEQVEQLSSGYAVIIKDRQRAAVDMRGGILVPPEYHVMHILGAGSFLAGKYRKLSPDGSRAEWTVINTADGTAVKVDKEHLFAITRHAPPQRFVTGDRLVGFDLLDHTGKVLLAGLDRVYELGPSGPGASEVIDPLYVFGKAGKAGAVDRNGNVVVPFEYDRLHVSPVGPQIVFRRIGEDRFGYMSRDGAVLMTPRFDEAAAFDADGRAPVVFGGIKGWIDTSGKFHRDNACDDGRRLVQSGGAYLVVGRDNQPLHRERWNDIEFFCDRPSRVTLGRRSGYLNADGSLVGGHLFYRAGRAGFREGIAEVWLERDRMLVLGPDGRRVLGPLEVPQRNFYARYPEGITRELLERATRDPRALDFGASRYCPDDGVSIYRASRNRTTYTDALGNVMIQGRYVNAYCFEEGLAWVVPEISERWCRMNKRGEVLSDTCTLNDPYPTVQKQEQRERENTREIYFTPKVRNWSQGWRGL